MQDLLDYPPVYIILFKDYSYQFSRSGKPKRSHHQEGARLFVAQGDVTINGICNWIVKENNADEFDWIEEIKDW